MSLLSRQEIRELAVAGVTAKVRDIERRLAAYHKEWPELFISKTPPQLLVADLKASRNGSAPAPWPPLVAPAQRWRKLDATARAVIATLDAHPQGLLINQIEAAHRKVPSNRLRGTLARLANTGRIRRVGYGMYGPAEGLAIEKAPPKSHALSVGSNWTPAMRKAAAKRMRARWNGPSGAKMRAGLARYRRERAKGKK